ncbi:MAG: hypothetical protein RLZZ262_271 [Bacteroidota bacterium]|jgi:hypothetical protein
MSNTTAPKFIGKRIKVTRTAQLLQLQINQKLERWQEALLIAWMAAWTFCGGVFIYEFFKAYANQANFSFRLSMGFCVVLWFFIWWRTGKVLLWRLIGSEVITFTTGKMTIQNAFGKWGRTESFGFENIFKLGLVKQDPTSFLGFLDNSFWIMGGERVGFNYAGTKIRLGKQLDVKDAEYLVRTIEAAMREYRVK